jgi:hypothetical protein
VTSARPSALETPDAAPFEGSGVSRPEPVEWAFNPWRERPGLAAFSATIVLGICLLVAGARESLILTAALCLAAAGAFAPALAPWTCRMDDQGAARRGPLGWERRAWSELRRAVQRPAGVFLSPYAARHWLDPYRGIFLPIPSRGRESLGASVRRHLERHGL